MTIDTNCDMGEGFSNDAEIMPFVSSVNIACGKHAGDKFTIQKTILCAEQLGVKIGAHPSFDDRANFGRSEMPLNDTALYQLVAEQMETFLEICAANTVNLHHVKPHGALYNLSAKNKNTAQIIAEVIKALCPNAILYGLSGSESIAAAEACGLKTASEVFADRTYQDDGSLTPRNQMNALIESETESIAQVLSLIESGTVISISGKKINRRAETVCIHGDSKHAVTFAKTIYQALKTKNIALAAV